MELLLEAVTGLFLQSKLELLAAALSIAYLVLIIRQNILAWPCAFVSTAIYVVVFWEAALRMESLLNVYYLLMAIYGCWHWAKQRHQVQSDMPIVTWPIKYHACAIVGVLLLSYLSGTVLASNTVAQLPYLDSFTTWGAVLATYMVARKVFENWYYWLVIDSVALYLYIDRALYPTALMMAIYLVMVFVGIAKWRQELRNQPAVPVTF